MQLRQHTLLRDLTRLLHLKLLIRIQPFLARHLQDGPLHERVQHALLDGYAATVGAGVGVEEEDGRLLGAVVRVRVSIEGEARFGGGDGGDERGKRARSGGGGREEVDGFCGGVYFLLGRSVTWILIVEAVCLLHHTNDGIRRRGKERKGTKKTHKRNNPHPLTHRQLLQRHHRIIPHRHRHLASQMNLPLTRSTARLLLRAFHLAQTLLLLRQRRVQRRVRIVLLKPSARQLLGRRREDGLPEVFRPQLAHERQPRRGEQHLLPHGRRVGHVGDGDQGRGGVVAPEDDVEGLFLFDVRGQEGVDVGGEGGAGGGGGQGLDGLELFVGDVNEEAEGR